MTAAQVLLVDDEPKVLSSLARGIMEEDICEVRTAQSGAEGIEILKKIEELALIVSDYHMPGMDGVTFLSEAQKIHPDTTRIMLTGAAGLEMAIDAVNRGRIFRFLLKPCPAEIFIASIKAGIRQYQLITAERELLHKTLNGSVRIMVDILSALNPGTFAQANRLRDLARSLAMAMKLEQVWEVELAALLCRIGSVTVPTEILEKWEMGYPMNDTERSMIQSVPRVGEQLVHNIPRFENVARAIGFQHLSFDGRAEGNNLPAGLAIPVAARILKVVADYDLSLSKNIYPVLAMADLLRNAAEYDPEMLAVFQRKVLNLATVEAPKHAAVAPKERKTNIEDVTPGMMLARDVFDKHGRLVVSKGTLITEMLKQRLVNYFLSQAIVESVVVKEEKFI